MVTFMDACALNDLCYYTENDVSKKSVEDVMIKFCKS